MESGPIMIRCCCCGDEVGFGSEARALDIAIAACSKCPAAESARAALREGIAAVEDGDFNPYEEGSVEWIWWTRGYNAAIALIEGT